MVASSQYVKYAHKSYVSSLPKFQWVDIQDDEDGLGVDTEAKNGIGVNEEDGYEDEEEESKFVLNVHQIDAHWLQRGLSKYYDDANISAKLADDVLDILQDQDELECESKLIVLLDVDKFDFIKLLLRNRAKIFYCTKLRQAQSETDKKKIEEDMLQDVEGGGPAILQALEQKASAESWAQDRTVAAVNQTKREGRLINKEYKASIGVVEDSSVPILSGESWGVSKRPEKVLDLESLQFAEGGHTMTNKKCELHDKSWRAMKKGYEEVHVPALKHVAPPGEKLVDIKEELPEWTHKAFANMRTLNRIQSKIYKQALYSSDNILLCAPTGAGKTNVAMLTMLHEIGQHRKEDGSIDLDAFKIVYVAPMKALVQECVLNFGQRLEGYGIQVKELSGDQSLTRQQISETQVIVTTPEKWDIITRKSGDRTYTQLVRLIIIDEIHLLHDDRGPVLESIVARTIRQIETTQEMVRIVGLSATLPNFEDVATFMRVDPEKGLFYFDNSYRPVPLQQQYIGITERKAIKRFQLMNEICYEKVLEQAGKNQVLIFVHSRAETAKAARALRDLAVENDTVDRFIKPDSATREILRVEAEKAKNDDLKDLLPYGFAIHHAGMARVDRNCVEDLFADRHVQVLVSTATLAWGVNLPAHTVILRGTQMYSPDKGKWVELSPLDVMQMMGRAGRPQYDSEGEGIIITQHSELQFYLSLMNQQLPVESQFIKKLVDNLNAEVVLGSLSTVKEAVNWLGYSYLYVRMLRNPTLYGISVEEAQKDPFAEQRRLDLIHTAAATLDKQNLMKYDRKSGSFQVTALGRVASHYYVTHDTIVKFNDYLKPNMSDIDLFHLFSLSSEFQHIHVREEEKLELAKLAGRVPIPVKESIEEPSAKTNILLQAYISDLKLEGFALVADMQFVQQSACRLMRALFEIALKRNWAALADKTLNLCKMIERRMWLSQSPLRQFRGLPEALIRKLEKKEISWERYFDMSPQDLGELVKAPKMGKTLHMLVHQFPKLELNISVQPITRSLLKVELTIIPDFQFDPKVHDYAQLFWVVVEDVDQEHILHHEAFLLKSNYAGEEHIVNFTVPILDPLPPQYFVRVVSDRWLHAEVMRPISFRNLILPAKFPPHTELLDLQPLPVSALRNPGFEKLYKNIRHFNSVQTQVFSELYDTDNNVLICAPPGSGKTVCAEFAILRHFNLQTGEPIVYVSPKKEVASQRFKDWSEKFGEEKVVVELTGDSAVDYKLLETAEIVISTSEQWDLLSRRWSTKKSVQNVGLVIIDDLHLLGGLEGPTLEIVVSRMRQLTFQIDKKIRLVGLSACVANAKDVGDWMGAVSPSSSHGLFNFRPDVPGVRPVPLETHLQGFEINHFSSRLLAMAKPVFAAVAGRAGGKPSLVFVPSRKQSQLTAIDLMTYAAAHGNDKLFLHASEEQVSPVLESIRDPGLRTTLAKGVGFVHAGLSESDKKRVWALYEDGVIQVVVVPNTLVWEVTAKAHLVVIMGTEYYDGKEHRYVDYPITDVLQMIGLAGKQGVDKTALCVIMCHSPKKEYLKRLLYEPLPIESHLHLFLHDHMNAEVVNKTVENKQEAVEYMTFTFLWRRLVQNPNYYNLRSNSSQFLSSFLSELVEETLADLASAMMLRIDEDVDLVPLNLGMIAAYYYVHYETIKLFAGSITAKTKTRGILELLASASEYSHLLIRQKEDRVLQQLSLRLPQKLPDGAKYHEPHIKALILLQGHLSRIALATDLKADQKEVISNALKLLQALVDVISSEGWLKPCLAAMEICQMIVQGMWDKDSLLLQIPHFTPDIVERCSEYKEAEIETPFDIIALEDEVRDELLQLPPGKMADVAVFCNSYPNIELNFDVQAGEEETVRAGEAVTVLVSLEREGVDEDTDVDSLGKVIAPLYPHQKMEGWWLVLGDPATNKLLVIKRIPTFMLKAKTKLQFAAPEGEGEHNLKLYFMCDSYLGCDQEYDVPLQISGSVGDDMDED